MHAMETFVTAAYSGTFSRAADELFVTQSAVSRQIQQLEENLGVALFLRHKRGLSLTPEGEALLPIVEEAFGQIGKICDMLRGSGQVLTLRMPPTLAARWFIPRLPSLREAMPDVDVRLTTYDAWEPSFADSDIDAAIVQGTGDWPDVEATLLMREQLTPVCSPEMAERLLTVHDLLGIPLLHCYPLNAWSLWLDAAGSENPPPHRGQIFDTLELALSAATRGQGVALGDINLIGESLRDRVLVRPFEFLLDRGVSYYLVYPRSRAQLAKIRTLRDWLLSLSAR